MGLLKTILAVGSGSFLGGTGRYLVSVAMKDISVVVGVTLVALGYFLVR